MTPIELHKHIQQKSLHVKNLIHLDDLCSELGLEPEVLLPAVEVLHHINFIEVRDNDSLQITEAGLYSNLGEFGA